MQLVYTIGCFDILHVGHIEILRGAKALGDVLCVGVPCDDVITEDKHRPPIIPLRDRIRMLQALRCVDLVCPYYEFSYTKELTQLRPQVFVVGEEWGGAVRHVAAEQWCERNNCRLVKLPYYRDESSTAIKNRIKGAAE